MHTLYLYGHTGGHHITFLSLNSVPELGKKAKFRNMFDIAYFSNRYIHSYMYASAPAQLVWFIQHDCSIHERLIIKLNQTYITYNKRGKLVYYNIHIHNVVENNNWYIHIFFVLSFFLIFTNNILCHAWSCSKDHSTCIYAVM